VRGHIIEWRTNAEIVKRALNYVGDPRVRYQLKYPNGGTDPDEDPQDKETGFCDCAGFADNMAGFDRLQKGGKPQRWNGSKWVPAIPFPDTPSVSGGYINTDSMVEEATLPKLKQKNGKIVDGQKWFTVLEKPEDGCFIVAPSFRRRLPPFNRVIGHIGVVVDSSEWETKGLAGLQVVHCSSKNHKAKGNVNKSAVWKTDGTLWGRYRDCYFVRFNREYALGLK
jgi:hypothetical protein